MVCVSPELCRPIEDIVAEATRVVAMSDRGEEILRQEHRK